jgi:hypothetical protein
LRSFSSFVSGAKITVRVISGPDLFNPLFNLALPGALGPVRRDNNPLTGERVETAVGMVRWVEFHYLFLSQKSI